MPPGIDGDDEELFEIDVEIDGPPPLPSAVAPESATGSTAEALPEALPESLADAGDTEPNRGLTPAEEPPPGPPDILEISDAVELQPPIVEAAADELADSLALYEAEAAAADGGRRGPLLLELARLREVQADDPAAPVRDPDENRSAVLESARAAFAADPASMPALWLLRRLLARAGGWQELETLYE